MTGLTFANVGQQYGLDDGMVDWVRLSLARNQLAGVFLHLMECRETARSSAKCGRISCLSCVVRFINSVFS